MNKSTILIVDDEAKFLKSLSVLLKRDFNVLTALNGKEGLSAFESNPEVSLILLDLDMPVMNGVEMLQRIRESGNNIKVLIMTGKSTHEWARECANLTIQGYIEKPLDPEKLIEKLKELLGIMECKVLKELWREGYKERMASLSHLVKSVISNIQQSHESKLARSEIADNLNRTPSHLSYAFHKECGIQLRDYINMHRILRSREYMIKFRNMKIQEVATSVGIADSSYFIKLFKKYTGCTPHEYRKNFIS